MAAVLVLGGIGLALGSLCGFAVKHEGRAILGMLLGVLLALLGLLLHDAGGSLMGSPASTRSSSQHGAKQIAQGGRIQKWPF